LRITKKSSFAIISDYCKGIEKHIRRVGVHGRRCSKPHAPVPRAVRSRGDVSQRDEPSLAALGSGVRAQRPPLVCEVARVHRVSGPRPVQPPSAAPGTIAPSVSVSVPIPVALPLQLPLPLAFSRFSRAELVLFLLGERPWRFGMVRERSPAAPARGARRSRRRTRRQRRLHGHGVLIKGHTLGARRPMMHPACRRCLVPMRMGLLPRSEIQRSFHLPPIRGCRRGPGFALQEHLPHTNSHMSNVRSSARNQKKIKKSKKKNKDAIKQTIYLSINQTNNTKK
jgi:hypothetical protein